MRSQGFPISIVAVILIVLVAMAIFIGFFIYSSQQMTNQTHAQGNFARCQALCADIASKSNTSDDVSANSGTFCSLNCDDYFRCNPNDLCASGGIDCSASPTCS